MKITYNTKNIKMINNQAQLALIDTAEAIKADLLQSQTMPFDTGTMQNDSTFVDDKRVIKGVAKIVVGTAYARKVYFDPELNIRTDKNPNAKQYYFDTYITGAKKNLPIKWLKQSLKRRIGQ
ncbi:MAG: hypothetical protein HFJ52_00150 [Clostridia bacterium]|nr:hypothetical protein [Clostridia bacterium]